jgi:hypothetical protein
MAIASPLRYPAPRPANNMRGCGGRVEPFPYAAVTLYAGEVAERRERG